MTDNEEHPDIIVHVPGDCVDPPYGNSTPLCDGIGHWVINPYAEEIYGDTFYEYMCDGEYMGACMDI